MALEHYQHKIREFVRESVHKNERKELSSVLEMLWYIYRSYNPVEVDCTSEESGELELVTKPLAQKRKRRLRRLICEMMVTQVHTAFISGIQTGAQLMMELNVLDEAREDALNVTKTISSVQKY